MHAARRRAGGQENGLRVIFSPMARFLTALGATIVNVGERARGDRHHWRRHATRLKIQEGVGGTYVMHAPCN